MDPRLEQSAITTIRTLAIDTVQAANSGHPGAPMGCAPMAHTIWTRHLRHAPRTPGWFDRDRFILSNGHASALLYSLLHLTGYGLTIDDLKSFRQWGSLTPGHPEYGLTAGVEATTGPLGQGFANGVGMAIAERRLAAEFNRPGHTVVDHRVFGIVSDGDLQEGIASEAASLAGHLRLGKLIYLWDDNLIQLDGPTSTAWSEDVRKRFDAYGWHTSNVADGNDVAAIDAAISAAIKDDRPSLIAVRTVIGFGSPNKAGSQKSHGAPLGPDEVKLTKSAYGANPDANFDVPADVAEFYRSAISNGEALVAAHTKQLLAYATAFPAEAAELQRRMAGELPSGWERTLPTYEIGGDAPTRNVSQSSIKALAAVLPELIGGSADLSESNLTDIHEGGRFTATESGRNI
ncbi:MAG: transketolase, partial [Candidatus Limnocylindrus sp.]